MFKCEITDHFGPFCGHGGYGSITRIGMDKSPKRAVAKASAFCAHDGSRSTRITNDGGGGVPIMCHFKLYKNGKVIMDILD